MSFPECFIIVGESEQDPRLIESHYICTECKQMLDHRAKSTFMAKGIWVPAVPTAGIQGYHVSQLNSTRISPHRLAISVMRGRERAVDEQELHNSKLGAPHIVAGAAITEDEIKSCIAGRTVDGLGTVSLGPESYKMRNPNVLGDLVTIGIDVGTSCNYVVTVWKMMAANTVDINESAIGFLIEAGKFTDYFQADELIKRFHPRHLTIDQQPDTRAATMLAHRWPGIVSLCHYSTSVNAKALSYRKEDFLVTANRTSWLDQSLGRFRARTIFLPTDIPQEFIEHITHLIRKPEKNAIGEVVYRYLDTGPDHYAHGLTYAEIALKMAFDLPGLEAQSITERRR